MRKINSLFRTRAIGVCIGALLTAGAAADGAAQMYVGYANPQEVVYDYTGFTNSSNETYTLCFEIRVEASRLANFNGTQLTGMLVGWSQGQTPRTPEMTVHVRESINGENLAVGKQTIKYGYNEIAFETPYKIEEGKDIWLGGEVEWEPDAWLATGIFGYNLPEKTQFMGNTADVDENGNPNWIDVTDNNMALLILGIVEATGDEYNDKGALENVRANEVQSLNYPGNAYLVIRNDGFNSINRVELTASFGDKTWQYPLELSNPIAGGETKKIYGGIQALGSGAHQVWLSKINGKEVENPNKVDIELIGVPEEVSDKYTRRPLVEYWVSESNYRTPVYTDDVFLPGVNKVRDEVSLLSHHCSDQFMVEHQFDSEVDCEDLQMLIDFAGGDKMRVYVPAFSVDRSYIPENPISKPDDKSVAYNFIFPDYVEGLYEAAYNTPTFASVNVTGDVSDGKCNLNIHGDIEQGVMPDGEPLYLTVYLVENDLLSLVQEFPDNPEVIDRYNGEYTFHDVIRHQFTEMYGTKVENDGSYSMNFDCEIDPEWNVANLRAVAVLNRSNERAGHMQVMNSAERSLDPNRVSAIGDSTGIDIRVSGHEVTAAGADSFSVYTVSGQKVDNRALPEGIYLVRAVNGNSRITRKVVVK